MEDKMAEGTPVDFVAVANAITCSYGTISSFLMILGDKREKNRGLSMAIIVLDLIIEALLASANGAAVAIAVIGHQGNSHVHWKEVCSMFGRFCHEVAAAVVVSLLASVISLLGYVCSS